MTQEVIQSYTKRITQGNRSEIIVVLYEMFFSYMEDATEALSPDKDCEAANDALRHASLVLEHLKNALDFRYEIAGQLFPVYVFEQKQIAKAMYLADGQMIEGIIKVMRPLYEAFQEVAKQDVSEGMMGNAEKVVAGYTYGRTDLNETTENYDTQRGFLA